MENADIVIIGSGQGGVPLAVEFAGQGKRVVLFEKDRLGGSCVNRGCTPSKAFLGAAHAAGRARQSQSLGIYCEVQVDFAKVMDRVRRVRDQFTEGVAHRLKNAGVHVVHEEAAVTSDGLVRGGQQAFKSPLVVINTGSRAKIPSIDGLSNTPYLTDANFWELRSLPRTTAVIGSGYISLELGQGLARLGSEVHIFARGGGVLSGESPQIGEVLSESLAQDGVQFHYHTSIERISYGQGQFTLKAADHTWQADALLVATGRTPNTDALNAEHAGIQLDQHGYIQVNARFESTRPGVYVIGEAAGQPAFTHVAWEDYRRLLDILQGGERRRDDRVLGYAIFTEPQVGRAGLSLEQAKEQGLQPVLAEMEVKSMARAIEWGHSRGFYRLIAEKGSGRILGTELVGYEVSELANLFIDLIEKGVTVQELAQWQHIHPTYAENLPTLARKALQQAHR